MKNRLAMCGFLLLLGAILATPALAQTSIKGNCKDLEGKPVANGIVVLTNLDNGQKAILKTDKQGNYLSLGVTPGKYKVSLYKNDEDMKADKPMFFVNGFPVVTGENSLDFDLKKEQEKQAQGQGMTAEQAKAQQEANEKVKKENNTIKSLNEKIVAANTAMKAGDYDSAVTAMTEASQIDGTRDVIWGLLADATRGSALKMTDRTEKNKRLDDAVTAYQKAIDLKQKAMDASAKKDPEDPKRLAGYYNNMADAYAKSGKVDDAVKAYNQAAQINPEGAAGYYFNAGAVLTNAGKVDDATAAFDKAIAADPTKAEAYYQKGVNLMGKATLQGDKTIPAPGTVEAFQKYLQLAPDGPNAQNAKDLLTSLGSSVQTSFGTKKKPK